MVIGSGLGGLCAAALLSRYGNHDVLVLESHYLPGGAAHGFARGGYRFDTGPSLFSGLSSKGPQANPLAQVGGRRTGEGGRGSKGKINRAGEEIKGEEPRTETGMRRVNGCWAEEV